MTLESRLGLSARTMDLLLPTENVVPRPGTWFCRVTYDDGKVLDTCLHDERWARNYADLLPWLWGDRNIQVEVIDGAEEGGHGNAGH